VQETTSSVTPTIQTEFVRGDDMGGGIGGILYRAVGVGLSTLEHFTYSQVGHTVALTGALGTVIKSDLYEAFGNIVASTGSSSNNRLANTKERSFTLGLDNHGFRYYDPEIGRYISADPLGYMDGLNLYTYVGNNPINRIDPLGLKWGWLDTLQAGLDVLGCIPVIGEAADLVNAGVSVARGDYSGAALSLVSMVPVVGDAIGKGGKVVKAGVKLADEAGAVGKQAVKHVDEAGSALKQGEKAADLGVTAAKNADEVANSGTKAAREASEQTSETALKQGGGEVGNQATKYADDVPASVPVGRRSSPGAAGPDAPQPSGAGRHNPQHVNPPYQPVQNAPGSVLGREYSGHAFDQMRNRGLTPTVVENAIQTGSRAPGNTVGTTLIHDAGNNVTVIINSSGRVITVY
jgi:RHS repeat-associated protein